MKITNNIKGFVLLLVGIILGMSVINVNAANVPTSVKMKSKSSLYYFTEKKSTDYIDGYNFYRKELNDGTLAYCSSNITTHVPAGKTLKLKGEVTDKGLAYIVKNGYPNNSFTGNDLKDYYITQAAIWRYYDETRGSSNWKSSSFKSTSTGMRGYVYDLVQEAKLARNAKTTSSITASIANKTMELSGNSFVSEKVTVKLNNTLQTYNVSIVNAPNGTKIMDTKGNEKTLFKNGEKFTVSTPISNIKGNIKLKITATGVDDKVYEYTTSNSYYQDIIVVTTYRVLTGEVSTTLDLNFNLNTKVAISKQDIANKKELAGATLVVKNSSGNEIDKWV